MQLVIQARSKTWDELLELAGLRRVQDWERKHSLKAVHASSINISTVALGDRSVVSRGFEAASWM